MGSTQARGFAEAVSDGEVSLEQALSWHLQANHYPPVPTSIIPACLAAIDAYNEEDYDAEVDLPEGITWRGRTAAPAHAIIEAHHLDAFLSTL